MLAEPDRTNYDLTFRLFGFPVRVHPLFWLMSAVLGGSALQRLGVLYWLAWVAVVFVSILVHELGHGLAYRWFGTGAHLVLYSLGGLAVGWSEVRGRWRRVVVALAGPVAGFLLFGLVYGSDLLYPWSERSRLADFLYFQLLFVNLVWGLVNLLPVVPLDGGKVSQEVCSAVWRRNGEWVGLQVSFALAALLCVYSIGCEIDRLRGGDWLVAVPWYARGSLWTALLFGMLAYASYQLLQQHRWTASHWQDDDDRPPWR